MVVSHINQALGEQELFFFIIFMQKTNIFFYFCRCRMVIEWREHNHEVDENDYLQNLDTIHAFQQCGLLKYFTIPTMRIQRELLKMLIGYWDPNQLEFIVDGERVSFKLEDIYSMTILSHRGEVVNLRGGDHIEGALTIQEQIDVYCEDGAQKVASQIPMVHMQD